jgi:hypothetical protein
MADYFAGTNVKRQFQFICDSHSGANFTVILRKTISAAGNPSHSLKNASKDRES